MSSIPPRGQLNKDRVVKRGNCTFHVNLSKNNKMNQ